MKLNLKKSLPLILATTILTSTFNISCQSEKSWVGSLGLFCGAFFYPGRIVHTFIHELGHAIIDLTLRRAKEVKIKIDVSLIPKTYWGITCPKGIVENSFSTIISAASGPIAGIIFEVLLFKWVIKHLKSNQTSRIKKLLLTYILFGSMTAIILEFNNIIPKYFQDNYPNDGMRIKEELFG
jgi:hypothetical protein